MLIKCVVIIFITRMMRKSKMLIEHVITAV